MKRSETKSISVLFLIFFTALGLIVPNVWLDLSEQYISVIGKIVNVLFPISLYVFIMALFRRPGWGVICLIPFMVFAAFQIVLLFLYGESIIAVDMFLNVVTTDFEEATTLLGNLMNAIFVVVVLYLPAIIWGIYSVYHRQTLSHYYRLCLRWWSGCATFIFGVLFLIVSLTGSVKPDTDIFPINVFNNIGIAVKRDRLAREYPASAESFTYQAVPVDSTRKIVVIVIGETSRPDRWQLFGAERETNPLLSMREDIITVKKAVTQSNTTHKSVPLLLTPLTAENFNDLNSYKSLITAFKEAGFETSWLSNQPPNGAYNEHIGYEADTTVFYKYVPDFELASVATDLLSSRDSTKSQLLVLHTYGGHFPYHERYVGMAPVFEPDDPMTAKPSNRETLLNAYDNATIATDIAIDSIIGVLSNLNEKAVLIYAADHGEDIFDDYREKFLHASPAPTYFQLRVPMLIWTSKEFLKNRNVTEILRNNSQVILSPAETVFHTALDAGGIITPYFDSSHSLLSPDFKSSPLLYLTDRNQVVPLKDSGLREVDIEYFKIEGIEF